MAYTGSYTKEFRFSIRDKTRQELLYKILIAAKSLEAFSDRVAINEIDKMLEQLVSLEHQRKKYHADQARKIIDKIAREKILPTIIETHPDMPKCSECGLSEPAGHHGSWGGHFFHTGAPLLGDR